MISDNDNINHGVTNKKVIIYPFFIQKLINGINVIHYLQI